MSEYKRDGLEVGADSGMPIYLTLEYAHSYGHELQRARFATAEEKKYFNPDWWQDHIMFPTDNRRIALKYIEWPDNPKRPADGAFKGCTNDVWIISQEEWDNYIALNEQRRKEAKERERIQKIESLKHTLAIGKAQTFLPTEEEARQMRKRYNDIHNEGGYGYVPHYVTKEEYEKTSECLRKLGVEPKPWRDNSAPVNEVTLSDGHGWEVKFTEDGWELLKKNEKDSGYLHVDYDSPDHITDKLKEVLMVYWGEHPRDWPGLGGTPQGRYGLNCVEFHEKRTGEKIFLT